MALPARLSTDAPQVIYENPGHRLKIITARTSHRELCRDAIAVYERSLGRPTPDGPVDRFLRPCDPYSHLLCLYAGDTIMGTCSITFSKDGSIDTPDVYPRILFDRFGPDIFSIYRMGIWRGAEESWSPLQQRVFFARYFMPLLRTAFVYGLQNGGRLMLSLATEKTVDTFCAITCHRLPTPQTLYHPAQPDIPVYPIYAVADPSLRSVRRFTRGWSIERPLKLDYFNEVLSHSSPSTTLKDPVL